MKFFSKVAVVFASFLLGISYLPRAGTLSEEYRAVELRQDELVKKRMDYEVELRKLSARRHSLNMALNQCFSQNFNNAWELKIKEAMSIRDKLEEERNALVKLRLDIDNVREELELKRVKIEKKYNNRNRGEEYEVEFRQYMSALEMGYFSRLEKDLFMGYETYLSKVEEYHMFLEGLVDECTGKKSKVNQ